MNSLSPTQKRLFVIGLILGLASVILGAFGTHYLESRVNDKILRNYETATNYQMYHALLMIFVSTSSIISERIARKISWIISLGIIIFSGTIYTNAFLSSVSLSLGKISVIIPIGGLLLIFSWVILIYNTLQKICHKKEL